MYMKKNNLSMRQQILKFVLEQYGTEPEYMWATNPNYAVLRHSNNNKWYAIIMDVPRNKLGLQENDIVDILDIKCEPVLGGSLRMQEGILPAYHMNKGHWLTVLLDGTVDENLIFSLIEMSFDLTDKRKKNKTNHTHNTEWLIPANPKYYDIETAISENSDSTFLWKQSNSIFVNDSIYIYVGAPISAICYKCKAIEVDIPYQYSDDCLTINRAMRLKLTERYDKTLISLNLMKEHGVNAVRGPRSIPKSLISEIDRLSSQAGGR